MQPPPEYLMTKPYPSHEIRTPRETWTRKLIKMCERLDQKSSAVTLSKDLDGWQSIETSVQNVWVFGSYARGAQACANLNLFVDVGAADVSANDISRAFLGTMRDVRVYKGKPQDKTIGLNVVDARLVWSPGLDWKAAIKAIHEDPEATRLQRESDRIVLRSRQTRVFQKEAEAFLKECDEGCYVQSFIGIDKLDENLSQLDVQSLDIPGAYNVTAQTRKVMPYLASCLQMMDFDIEDGRMMKGRLWRSEENGVVAYLGDGGLNWKMWLDDPGTACTTVIFIPDLNARGPNGAWVIERGPNHPLALRMKRPRP